MFSSGWTFMAWISWFCSDCTSGDWSVYSLKVILSRAGFVPPYHAGFLTMSIWSLVAVPNLNGPPDQVGRSKNFLYEASRPASVLMSPDWAAMCAGYSPLNRPFQSGYVVLNVTVTVLPLSEPSTEV